MLSFPVLCHTVLITHAAVVRCNKLEVLDVFCVFRKLLTYRHLLESESRTKACSLQQDLAVIQVLWTFHEQSIKMSRARPQETAESYTGSLYSHRQLKRASEGWGLLLWVVLWQCLSWLLCGVRTKQSASILPQKLVTLGGQSIRHRSCTRLPTCTQRLERDKKRETLVCTHYQTSLAIHSSSNCECQLLFIGTTDWTLTATWVFQVKDWFMLTVCLLFFPWHYCHS